MIAQQGKEEQKIEKKTKERSNSNVAPAYLNEVETEMDEAPAGKILDQVQVQSSVLINASQNLQQTLIEIKQMSSQKTPTSKQFQKLNYKLLFTIKF
jgi:hypothetical protein